MDSVIAFIFLLTIVAGGFIFYRQMMSRLAVIHDLVNSNLTKVQADLKIALKRIEILESHLARGIDR